MLEGRALVLLRWCQHCVLSLCANLFEVREKDVELRVKGGILALFVDSDDLDAMPQGG